MIILVLSYLFVCFITLLLTKFFYELWWNPIRIQSALSSKGIAGPSYRFYYGNSDDMIRMRKESASRKNYVNWIGPQPQLIITELQLVKEILNNKDEYPKPEFKSFTKKIFGDGLLRARGEKWFRQRKLANHAFHGENLKGMIPAMIASVEMMLERWRQHEGKEIEVNKEFKILTSEIISRTAFGSSHLEGQHIFEMLSRLVLLLSINAYKVRIPGLEKIVKTKDEIESDKLEQDVRDSILKMIRKREEEANQEADKTKKISIDDIVDDSLTWTIFLLAIHTDWQEKARNEILQLFGQENPTSDYLSRLKIMTMIVNESQRLYTPIIALVREIHKGTRLGNLIAPSKMDILIPTLALHHDPEIWGEDVHLFKPERFAEGVAKATKNNIFAFCPFSLGPRNCVGMNFALTEIKIALLMILQRYRFTLSPTYVHSPVILLATCPQKGLPIILQPL
ncbi:hypothetical protein P3X46_017198 [Hevea brasiliensis]|uniref:Cytochrome P450 n=1 Tax=Hevea brasiliensis TaxID=3981 RepID=A0ABQ9M2R0_HEVBR|nr:hypothetical protein P3X46_017198 [Hevea brasiliensis]